MHYYYYHHHHHHLQLGYHPVAVVILHVHKYGKKKVTRKFKSGGLHERHVVELVRNLVAHGDAREGK